MRGQILLDMVTNWMWVREGKARDDPQVSGLATGGITELGWGAVWGRPCIGAH